MLSIDGRNLAILNLDPPRSGKSRRSKTAAEDGLFKDWDLYAVRCDHCSNTLYHYAVTSSIESFQGQVFAEIKPRHSKEGVFMLCTSDKKEERKVKLWNYIR